MINRLSLTLSLLLLCSPPAAFEAAGQGAGGSEQVMGPRLSLWAQQAHARGLPQALDLISIYREGYRSDQGPCLGRVCLDTVAPQDLSDFLDRAGLLRVDLPNSYRPRLDRADSHVGAAQARRDHSLGGSGVYIAVIDTGLDWTHPDFQGDDGLPRVAWVLDQTMSPQGMHPHLEELGGGAVFSKADLLQALDDGEGTALFSARDTIGHGTHVAGIATSSDPTYTGVAPKAELLAIKGLSKDGTGFPEDQLFRAMAFSRAVALGAGRPLVINLSLGSQLGAHDGGQALELAIDALVEEGTPPCAVVVAAGNEAGLEQHARAALSSQGLPLRFEVLLPQGSAPGDGRPAQVLVDVWFDGEGDLSGEVISPGGSRSGIVDSILGPRALDTWTEDGWVGLSSSQDQLSPSGLKQILIQLRGEAGMELATGVWTIELRGQAKRVDAWIGEYQLANGPGPRFLSHVDDNDLVGPPASARRAIAVGAHVNRARWTDADGRDHQRSDLNPGAMTLFSVNGPTRDDRAKPELVAPGQLVASTLSSASDARSPTSMFYTGGYLSSVMSDGRHALASGTSMAAPFVAGMCALAFEKDPQLDPERLPGLLAASAGSDSHTGQSLYRSDWGFGKLWARGLLSVMGALGGHEVDHSRSLCGITRNWLPLDPQQVAYLLAVPRNSLGLPLGPGLALSIQAPGAEFAGPVRDHGNGIYSRPMRGQGRRGDRIPVSCILHGVPFPAQPELVLAASQAEAAGGGVEGGAPSCAQGGRFSATGLGGLAWLFLFLLGGRFNGRSSRSNWRKNKFHSRMNRRWK